MRAAMWTMVAVLALAVGCDDDDTGGGGPAPDAAGGEADGGGGAPGDAAPRSDAAPRVDAAPMRDAAPVVDAAPADDASAVVDAAPDALVDAAPVSDAAPDAAPVVDAAPPAPDAGDAPVAPDLPEGLCDACAQDGDCAGLGMGAGCNDLIGGKACVPGCAENADCPPAFACLFNRCIPSGARCDSCAVVGCPAGQQCSEFTGQCSERAGRCGGCQEDGDCAQDLFCRPVGLGRNCVEACVDGACPDGFRCDGGACLPASGFCDACGGCGGALPVCNPINRTCVECGPGNPCALGSVCDLTGACVAPPMGVECNSNLDCRDAARPICDMQRCIGCRDDAGCPAGQTCVENACADAGDPCAGVTCQEGSACAAGRCEPGCARDADCGDERRCNPVTGQCYRGDQRCDRDGATAVCAPGGVCRDDPLDRNRTVCSCLKTDPNDAMEANEDHRVPCQPGGQCLQFGADPGVCIAP